MAKYFVRIVLIILPILFILGLVRKAVDVENEFLPSYRTLISLFSSFPNFQSEMMEVVNVYNEAVESNINAWSNINDLSGFFAAVGSFFNLVGQFFLIVWTAIGIPFRTVGWFFSTLLGLTTA